MIRITAKIPTGRWRCGLFHPSAVTDHRDDRFTAAEIEQLRSDPMLSVELLKGEPEGLTPGPSPKGEGGAESAELDARKKALDEFDEELAQREQTLDERASALADREKAAGEREAALAVLKSDESFRHIVLLFAVQAVVEGKQRDDLTKQDLPTTEAIAREALGFYTVTAKERDELFAEVYPDGAE